MGIALLSVQAPHHIPLSQFHYTNTSKSWRSFSQTYPLESKSTILLCSTSSASVAEDTASPSPDDSLAAKSESPIKELPLSACKSCGREEVEKGCNGEGRIQGGIATFPGFGWWPIKAYRPCPGFLESGGRYKRQGQSLDEVAFGRGGKGEN
ncbi:hypothetical protein RchiOBHm_Chr7g0194141 [Rosa chinensis]|uniref:Uncharacterized protein n=1 Tax=Rosa chinensis TaxID=74649 RepID=A0A2P6P632_ROSCH|nr:uncharacterized protein LOC112179462 [Rosa chinensis]PRQ17362.1 hypothetical protein RchiOBHm_Chr7g0194141 [Rosa chinensis]